MAIQLLSNVKIITSGNVPTTANLLPGQAAFGKINSDGKYHLFGNTGEGGDSVGKVVDIVLDTYSAISAANLETVLTSGNTTKLNIVFQDAGGTTKVTVGPAGITMGTTTMTEAGFVDNGKVVLSANPSLTVSEADAATMRSFLNVYSKAEVDGKLAGAFHVKGSVNSFTDLPENAQVGDVYNIKTAGGTDIHGVAVKAGDNVVYVAAQGDDPAGWDVLSGLVDLSAYYTSAQVDGLLADYAKSADVAATYATADSVYTKEAADAKFALQTSVYTKEQIDEQHTAINTNVSKAQQDATQALAGIETINNAGYQTAADVNAILTNGNYVADANYVHTDKNYTAADQAKVAKLKTDGDGTKVLADNGEYIEVTFSVVSI